MKITKLNKLLCEKQISKNPSQVNIAQMSEIICDLNEELNGLLYKIIENNLHNNEDFLMLLNRFIDKTNQNSSN